MSADAARVRAAVADAHRREWAFVLAATVRVAADLDLAEECVQEAYVAALDEWVRDGIPRSPGAWLTTSQTRPALPTTDCRAARSPTSAISGRTASCFRSSSP